MKIGISGLVSSLLLLSVSCGPLGSDITSQSPGDYPILTSAVALTGSSVRVDWQDRSDGEEGFGIERRQAVQQGSSLGSFSLRNRVGPDTVSYEDQGLAPDTTYYYRIYYFRGDEKSRYSNIVIVTTPG